MKKDYEKTLREIQKGDIQPVYFLNGDDFFLQHFFISEVEKYLGKSKKVEKVFVIPDSESFMQLLGDLNSYSLFGETKLYILYNPTSIKGKNRDELLAYCQSPQTRINPDNYLVIIIDKYDPGLKLIGELKQRIGVINVSSPFPDEMLKWVKFLLNYHQISASTEAVDRLIELAGDSLHHVSGEIEKLKLGLGEKSSIEEKDVIQFSGWEKQFLPWQFLDAVGSRNFAQALLIGNSLMSQRFDMTFLISQMATLFQELLFQSLGRVNGVEKVESRQVAGKEPVYQGWLSIPVKRRLSIYQKNYDKSEIRKILRYLLEADIKLKSVSVKENHVFIPLIYRITSDV